MENKTVNSQVWACLWRCVILPSMKNSIETDIVIIGGGIAGLWLLNRLRQSGYSAILLETHTLGGGQTHKSQGIIHGGIKYALQGAMTAAAQAIADMPKVWESCLQGKGPIDLSQVPVLSQHQYLWSTGNLSSKITGFFASKTLQGSVQELRTDAYPSIFQHASFKGRVYSLDEIVIDVSTLIRELVKHSQEAIYKIEPLKSEHIRFDDAGRLVHFEIHAGPLTPLTIHAQKYIFAAGAGNEMLLQPLKSISMQRRPLHMVLMKTEFDHTLYGHCLGLSTTPRITITTHKAHDGKIVWYLGGQLAEEGVKRTSGEQINEAKKELNELFPWLNFSTSQFVTFHVDRAEPLEQNGKRPDSCFAKEIENVIAAWPTKLALAPRLADTILEILNIKPHTSDLRALRAWPFPVPAKPIWDELI